MRKFRHFISRVIRIIKYSASFFRNAKLSSLQTSSGTCYCAFRIAKKEIDKMTNSRSEFQIVPAILHARVVSSLTHIKINVVKYRAFLFSRCFEWIRDLRLFVLSFLVASCLFLRSFALAKSFLFLPLIKSSYASRDIVTIGDENNRKKFFSMKCN